MRTKNITPKGQCLFPNCVKPEMARGLCNTHYATAMKLIRTGQTTWSKLEVKGKSKPVQQYVNEKFFLE